MGEYTGYLAPYITQIREAHERGLSNSEIVALLPKSIPSNDPWFASRGSKFMPNATMINYVLRRLGPPGPPDPPKIAPIRVWIRFPMKNKGRPIDMGGPRDQWIDHDPQGYV